MRTKLTFGGLGLVVGLLLVTATPSQAATISTTVFQVQTGSDVYEATALGNIGHSAQLSGAEIFYSLSLLNTRVPNDLGGSASFININVGPQDDPIFEDIITIGRQVVGSVTEIGDTVIGYQVRQGTITFSPLLPGTTEYPFEHFEVTFGEEGASIHGDFPGFDPDAGVFLPGGEPLIIPGNEVITLGVNIGHSAIPPADAPDIGGVHIEFTSDGALPELPRQFAPEIKAKAEFQAQELDKLADLFGTLGNTTSDAAVEQGLANSIAGKLASGVSAQAGTAVSFAQSAQSTIAGALSNAPAAANPVAQILSITSSLDKLTSSVLKFIAADPPDGNYLEVFDTPDWSFGDIPGASAAGNALVQDTYAQFQESLNLLAAAERFQGADLAGDAAARAAQEAAFDAALDQYNQNRVTMSASLTAFLAELEAGDDVEDLNLEDDTSLADLQAYLASLEDPMTENQELADWIASMTDALPGLLAQPGPDDPSFIAQDVLDALAEIAAAEPHGLTGSAFDAIGDIAAKLAVPEPSAFALLMLGGLVALALRRGRRN